MMKNINEKKSRNVYIAPEIVVINIAVEGGFAFTNKSDIDDYIPLPGEKADD